MNARLVRLAGCLTILTVLIAAGTLRAAPLPSPAAPRAVLWIGNSFTFYNGSVPAMVQALAKGLAPNDHQRLRVGLRAVGGAHLPDHAHQPDLGIADDWDLVVLQGYSDEPIHPAKSAAFAAALATLAGRVHEADARLALFMTWAYRDRPAMTPALAQAYEEAAKRTGAIVIPVGLAFAEAQKSRPGVLLYVAADNKHPSPAGTYLAACTFYAAFFGRTPAGATFVPKGLAEADAAFLQQSAWETVARYYGWGG